MIPQEGLPDFIIGGAMKAGTTFLHRVLAQHPNVFIPDGEVHFFCVDDTIQHPDFWRVQDYDQDFGSNIEWYRSLFDPAPSGQLIGEDSTTYLPSPKAPERIRDVLPGVKLIFLLRDPVARTYSHYWHRVKTGRAVHYFEQELELGTDNLYLRSYYKSQLEPDTPHPLCRVGYIKPLVPGPEDRHHRSMVLLHVQDNMLLFSVKDVDPLETLEDPASGWPLSRLSFLVRI